MLEPTTGVAHACQKRLDQGSYRVTTAFSARDWIVLPPSELLLELLKDLSFRRLVLKKWRVGSALEPLYQGVALSA